MGAKYQNKEVTVVRTAKDGDPGFDRNKGMQSLIRLADGSEKVVPATEVTGAEQSPPAGGS